MQKVLTKAAALFMLAALSACAGGGANVASSDSPIMPAAQPLAGTPATNAAQAAGAASVARSSAAFEAVLPDTVAGDALPWVYAELWQSTSPYKLTVAQQKSRGATVIGQSAMNSLWYEGIARNKVAAAIPIYVAKSSDPLKTVTCTYYGGNCNAKNIRIHIPSYAIAQQESDGHMTVVDSYAPAGAVEIDCWRTSVSGSSMYCGWAGAYPLYGPGTPRTNGEGIHGGMAVTTIFLTGSELKNGHIDHALGMNTTCLNNPSVYPADTQNGTDRSCNGSSSPPHYGNLMHLRWSASQIAGSAYSAPCKVVLNALATYGAYLDDTGNNGLQLSTQNELSYTASSATKSSDPWPGIESTLSSGGDAGYGYWSSCLNRLNAGDFELLQVKA